MTNKTYRLAKESQYTVEPFGPCMTLAKAESYQIDMIKGGFNVLVVNVATLGESLKTMTRQDKIARMLKRHTLLTV